MNSINKLEIEIEQDGCNSNGDSVTTAESNSNPTKTFDINLADKCSQIQSNEIETNNDDVEDEDEEFFEDKFDELEVTNESNSLDKLIQKQRIELATELRRLQFGERPVTSSEVKTRIEELLNSRNEANTSRQTPLFRSSVIQNELSELGSQQRVRTILNNNRAALESSLQNILTGQRPQNQIQPQVEQRQINSNQSRLPYLEMRNPINNSIEQMTREQIISEISDLVHSQLVTNTLQNDQFRTRLEQRILDSIRRSGTNGDQTRENLRRLTINTTSYIQRNDFSHLGIISNTNNMLNQQTDDLSDSASSIIANTSRPTRVYQMSREIKELKSEINELKNLLKLSFDLQLDTQRAFRQEISALVSGTFQNSASASLIQTTRPTDEGNCVICTDNKIDSVLIQCGHMVCCFKCSYHLKEKNFNCPVCRAPILDFIRTYKCNNLE